VSNGRQRYLRFTLRLAEIGHLSVKSLWFNSPLAHDPRLVEPRRPRLVELVETVAVPRAARGVEVYESRADLVDNLDRSLIGDIQTGV